MQAHQATKEQDIEDVSQCLQGNLCRCTGQGLAHQNLLIQTKGIYNRLAQVVHPDSYHQYVSALYFVCLYMDN